MDVRSQLIPRLNFRYVEPFMVYRIVGKSEYLVGYDTLSMKGEGRGEFFGLPEALNALLLGLVYFGIVVGHSPVSIVLMGH